ncbi:MATE efflux family protein [[Clostridium] bifermentans ATCC 638]|uniref:Multidrug export protein MepA n=1 Tax=Paraclostridium bifermentans ATCC 638 = DSM 14991 TaxID=1233171 RepID=T4VSR2_PARBF|nr:MATE family efflux transporter [Paraclostridium bifermentans]EQK44523.1 MATE efflux family protein [[Clostridium] bifermentans ATCC 638] [Paraclostridium bifermentans ATCC 638 = DSM 14991]RIZ57613.1 MATE family efflux transporter [Paraclostridium bifermentans]UAG18624.1 MATE family efflux transporter [Paraclostridium bifermentans]
MGKQATDLGKGSVGKLLFQLALPAIIAQLVNVLYNIVDRIFIGRMPNGELAMAGVGVAFPIIMIVSAFSALVGMGGAPLAAIKMGEKDNDGAEKIMTNSFSALVIIAIILTVSLLIFKENILWAFGASKDTIGYANDYIGIYLIGTIFVQIGLGLNPFINTQGFAKTGMITVLIGAIINIVLDPILIFGFNMGVKGAALATISAQFVSAVWVLLFLVGKKSVLKIRKQYIIPSLKVIGPILLLGISPFIMQATESLVIISMNNNLAKYGGDLAIGAMTIMSSVMQIILLPMMGLTQGAQPIISFNYGADKLDRVRKTFRLLLVSCLVYTTLMWGAIMMFPQVFVSIFNSNPQLVEITVWSMRIYFAGILLFGAQIACQQTFLALGQAKISMILALLRKIILLIPLIFILPVFFENKLQGVLTAEPVADITAAIVTIICFSVFYKKTLSIDHSMQPTVEIAKTKDE